MLFVSFVLLVLLVHYDFAHSYLFLFVRFDFGSFGHLVHFVEFDCSDMPNSFGMLNMIRVFCVHTLHYSMIVLYPSPPLLSS